ncbi:MAG: hydroxyacid dehydrogenase [Kofleriaceae bacterium]|nr:MAG: hydroxyacid dehydrogenase [Kofleriaceae bacterium]
MFSRVRPVHILFCGSGWLDIVDLIASRLSPADKLRSWDRRRSLVDEVLAAPTDVILPSNALVDARVIGAAVEHGLRLIQQPAAGTDGIDLAAAAARGIPVCNAPGANQVAVAEAALLLLLLCARRWPAARSAFDQGIIGSPLGVELAGALGMHVRTTSSSTSRAELLAELDRADAVSLHCPLDDRTRGMIDAEALAAMQPHAILVNVARGAVIDKDALQDALARGHLGGVGLDVYWQEPWDPADPLYAHPRVVTLPHVAGSTTRAFDQIAAIVVENVTRLKRGDALMHRIA